jgi:siroheme synthase
MASQILFTTFSRGAENGGLEWDSISEKTTVAIYMPGRNYAEVASRLLDHGLSAETPCAVISQATGAQQKIQWSRVGSLYDENALPAPAILIVGKVAAREVREAHAHFSMQLHDKTAPLDHAMSALRKN